MQLAVKAVGVRAVQPVTGFAAHSTSGSWELEKGKNGSRDESVCLIAQNSFDRTLEAAVFSC